MKAGVQKVKNPPLKIEPEAKKVNKAASIRSQTKNNESLQETQSGRTTLKRRGWLEVE